MAGKPIKPLGHKSYGSIPHLIGSKRGAADKGEHGFWGATGRPEGVVYRVERKGKVDFLAKYVRPDYPTGQYLPGTEGAVVDTEVWHTY